MSALPTACEAVAVGGSMGALTVLLDAIAAAPPHMSPPVFVCLHLHPSDGGRTAQLFAERARVRVVEATDKAYVEPGAVYVAPADYHLLVERTRALALSSDEKVNFSRPSIDVLFESAALAYGPGLLAVLLSGASADGARGLAAVRRHGGTAVVQDPATAAAPMMPGAALEAGACDRVLTAGEITELFSRLGAAPSQLGVLDGLGVSRPPSSLESGARS